MHKKLKDYSRQEKREFLSEMVAAFHTSGKEKVGIAQYECYLGANNIVTVLSTEDSKDYCQFQLVKEL